MLPALTAASGTAEQVRANLRDLFADGRTDYLVLQLPTGDMSFAEARDTLVRFIADVMPGLNDIVSARV